MKSRFFLLLVPIIFIACTDKQTKKEIKTHAAAAEVQTYINQIKTEREKKLKDYIESMPLEQKIAQLFI